MISPEEIRIRIPYASSSSCENISAYIRFLYLRKYYFLYELDYELEITSILEKVRENYNPKLGQLNRYIKNTISLKLKDYMKRTYINKVELKDNTIGSTMQDDMTIPLDFSIYPDSVISAIYNVIGGVASNREKNIVNNLFKSEKT